MSTAGSYVLEDVGNLVNVQVARDGERWSTAVASGNIVPGEAVVIASGKVDGKPALRVAESGDSDNPDVAIALRPVESPSPNSETGPTQLKNTTLENGEYVLRYHTGSFWLTLVVPDTYAPGDVIGWDADGARPTGKSGTGAWAKNDSADVKGYFVVEEWHPVNESNEGYLLVRRVAR